MSRFVVLSGCSGGGKSTLLAELRRRGHAVVEEPGRRIIQAQAAEGTALPWLDLAAFLRRAVAMALSDLEAAAALPPRGWMFFDRGLIDAAAGLEEVTGEPLVQQIGAAQRYHRQVFLVPPWRAIYQTDAERRHGFDAAVAEYERLRVVYPALGYDVIVLPHESVSARADFVLRTLADGM